MGRPKALVPYAGLPLLSYQLAALEGFGQRIVVLGAAEDAIRAALDLEGATLVSNPEWESGRSGSLRLGFGAVRAAARAVLVTAVDQPLDPEVVAALLGAFDPSAYAYAIPVVEGRRGHPLLVGAALLPALRSLGDAELLRDAIARYADAALALPVTSREALLDLNRPEDLPSG